MTKVWAGSWIVAALALGCGGGPGRDDAPTDAVDGEDTEPVTEDTDAGQGDTEDGDGESDPPDSDPEDHDSDGVVDGLDCADDDPTVFPGADEVCDGVDQDCDLQADDGPDLCPSSVLDCVETTCQGVLGCLDAVVPGSCLIDGVCVADGEANPANACERCEAATNATAWTPRAGGSCDDGLFCTEGETCSQGVCGDGQPRDCSDAGANACEAGSCDEASGACVSTVLWGEDCDDGDACTVDTTCEDQGTGGVCGAGTPALDVYEANDSVATARVMSYIDDCGTLTESLVATNNPGSDVDWYRFTLYNTASMCFNETEVRLVAPPDRDYDLLVCARMTSPFTAECVSGTAVAAPAQLSGAVCCSSARGAGINEFVAIDTRCSGAFCSDDDVVVHVQVAPAGGYQEPQCTSGYTLTWTDP